MILYWPFGRSWGRALVAARPAASWRAPKKDASPSKRAGEDESAVRSFSVRPPIWRSSSGSSPWRNGRGSRLRRWRLPG